MPTPCLAGLEVSFISITVMVADAVAKAGDVRILGYEPTGVETILIRIAADSPAALEAALSAGQERALQLGVPAPSVTLLARPDPSSSQLNTYPNTINGIYGGREEMRPDDFNTRTTMKNKALGILETQGLTASLKATDAMFKAADVQLIGKEKIGAAYVAIMVSGDVAAVNAAIEAGKAAVGSAGKLIAGEVIARPHAELIPLLPGK